MENNILIRKIYMDCPLCDKTHEVEERKRITTLTIKGEEVSYEETFYFCTNSDTYENEFETATLSDKNLLNARNTYRKKMGLLTSNEIVDIRKNYGLSQVELAKLLGWGEATISRYESKAIQDDAYDAMLRLIKDNPLQALEFLKKNSSNFTKERVNEIHSKISEKLETYGKEFVQRKVLESEYVTFYEPSDSNGYTLLNIDKIESIISYFALNIPNLFKVKLMKMLWYSDTLYFKEYGRSITGMVYRNHKMGALPIGHYSLMNLENINVKEEYSATFDTILHIYPTNDIDYSNITKEEKVILDNVINKFKNYITKDIVNYMHKEKAYINTNPGDIIPFSLAKEINPF